MTARDFGPGDAELRGWLDTETAVSGKGPLGTLGHVYKGSLRKSARIAALEQRLARIAEIVADCPADPDDGAVVLVKEDADEVKALAAGKDGRPA